ncbi:PH domain-containing protein [bacterium]|nr:PH domain-containing protein [bacterium]
MDYVEKLLGTNEKIVFRTHRHFFTILGSLFKEIVVLVACAVALLSIRTWYTGNPFFFYIGIGIIAFLALASAFVDVLRWQNDEFVVTSRRVIHASGIFSKNILDSSLNKINDVILQQSWMGRIFGYGTIKILTATEEVINLLDHIRNPIGFKHAMLEAKSLFEPIAAVAIAGQTSATQLLEELDRLRARRMITDVEYEEKRKEILKRM